MTLVSFSIMQMAVSEYGATARIQDPSYQMTTLQVSGCVIMVWGMFSCRSNDNLDICGHNCEQHIIPQHRCRSRALVYGYNVPSWRWSVSAGQCTLSPCVIGLKLV
ncbi:hypothetical protein AVEN_270684-1 [Araneus ventricosus]|uniref:Uncharacterized protein n=1 Tax=Araneus ventricosus TaxID=182803 RepID=A0A4Y2FV29_ARAVE|nr:hypothetical protein AVEN_270684-1 [Araneus ventricosus]